MDNMVITQTSTTARWQIVVKETETKDKPKTKTTTKQQNYVLSIHPKDHRVTDNGITVIGITGEREINPLAKQ